MEEMERNKKKMGENTARNRKKREKGEYIQKVSLKYFLKKSPKGFKKHPKSIQKYEERKVSKKYFFLKYPKCIPKIAFKYFQTIPKLSQKPQLTQQLHHRCFLWQQFHNSILSATVVNCLAGKKR